VAAFEEDEYKYVVFDCCRL